MEEEKEADRTTTFQQLGIASTSFSINDSSGLLKEYTLDTDSTLGDFLDTLKSQGFTASIANGTISISSSSGKYITGYLADELGIRTTSTTVVEASTMSSTLALTGTSTGTADVGTTFGELGILGSTCVVNYNGSATGTITVKAADTIGSFIAVLKDNNVTASIVDGVLVFGKNGYTITGDLADILGITSSSKEIVSYTTAQAGLSKTIIPALTNNSNVVGTSTVATGTFKMAVNKIDTSSLASLSSVSQTSVLYPETYKISTTDELIQLAEMTNNGLIRSGTTIVLANDIDMSGIEWKTAIGSTTSATFYRCTFDGNGYTISNLSGSEGLFGEVEGSYIRNVGLRNVNINGSYQLGALANNVTRTSFGAVSYIQNCFVEGSITSNGSNAGGIAGKLGVNCIIENSYVDVDLRAGNAVGGIVGCTSYGIVTDCFSTGQVNGRSSVGGIVGSSDLNFASTIKNVASSCTVSLRDSSGSVGGILGSGGYDSINNVFFGGSISAGSSCECKGSIIGYFLNSDEVITKVTSVRAADTSIDMFGIWEVNPNENSVLSEFGVTSGDLRIYKDDGSTCTTYIDSTKTFADLKTQMGEYGINFFLIENSIQQCIEGTGDSYFEKNYGGSNLGSLFTFSKVYATVFINSPSSNMQYEKTETLESSKTLTTLPSYTHGTGALGVHLANGTTTTITLKTTDALSDLFTKLTPYGITGSITDGKVTFSSSSDTYLQSISGGSSLLSSLNLGTLSQTKTTNHKNTPSNPLSYTITTPDPTPQPDLTPKPDNQTTNNSSDFTFNGIGGNPDCSISIDLNLNFNLSVDVSTSDGARQALQDIDALLKDLNTKQTEIGSASNRFLSILEEISIQYENLVSSRSTLQDADIAEVSSDYIKWQILQQASATLLSTANQAPAVALGLL